MSGVILALDLATVTGWAVGLPGGIPTIGSIALPAASVSGRGRLFATFEDWLWDQIEVHQPVFIARESPMPPKAQSGFDAALIAFGLSSSVEQVCFRASIPQRGVTVWDVRQHFVGKRGAGKPEVQARCKMLNWRFTDDNSSDAAAVWSWACAHVANPFPKVAI